MGFLDDLTKIANAADTASAKAHENECLVRGNLHGARRDEAYLHSKNEKGTLGTLFGSSSQTTGSYHKMSDDPNAADDCCKVCTMQ